MAAKPAVVSCGAPGPRVDTALPGSGFGVLDHDLDAPDGPAEAVLPQFRGTGWLADSEVPDPAECLRLRGVDPIDLCAGRWDPSQDEPVEGGIRRHVLAG